MITAVDVVLRELPLTPVQMKGRTPVARAQQSVFVRITGDCGLSGYGEASAWAVFSEQNATAMAAVLRGLLAPAALGRAEHDRAGLHRAMDAAVPGNEVAKAAVDMAVHDLIGKQADLPVCDLIGGDARFRIALSYSVSVLDPEEITRLVTQRSEAGYRIFKLKVGALVPGCDFSFPYEMLDDSPVGGGPVRVDGELSLRRDAGHGANLPDEWFEDERK